MKPRTKALFLVAAVAAIGLAAPARGRGAGSGRGGALLFVGEVTAANVFVRSGPASDAYACTMISAPARVRVAQKVGDWLKILPVAGCYSAVSKADVRYDPDTGKATVIAARAWIRPGGDLCGEDFPGVQGPVLRGSKLTVIGQAGEFYKIKPPRGAYFYIAAKYVRPASAAAPTQKTLTPRPTTATSTTRPAAPEDATTAALKAADRQLEAEFDKPLDQRDLDGLLAKYQAIKLPADSALRPFLEYRIAFLKTAIRRRKDKQAVEDLLREAAARQKKLEMERAKLAVRAPASQPAADFAVKGVLVPSYLYPNRFAVRDPETRAILAYVRSAAGTVDLKQFVGQLVGVFGAKSRHRGQRISVVEAEQVERIQAAAPIAGLPKPKVIYNPPPRPEPKAEAKQQPTARPVPSTQPAVAPKTPTPLTDLVPRPVPKAPRPQPKVEPEPGPKVERKVQPSPEAKPEPTTKPGAEPEAKPKAEPKIELRIEPAVEPKTQPKPEPTKAVSKPEPKAATRAASGPAASTRPTTQPASPLKLLELLPETGLPVVSETQPAEEAVDEREYE